MTSAAQQHRSQIEPRARTPNILLVVADDVGIDMLPAYERGRRDYPTVPTLDALAERGIVFRNVWGCPLCSPTRATIQTGRYGFRTGVGRVVAEGESFALPLDELTLPEMLETGTGGLYRTAAIGKWHLGNSPTHPNEQGWEHFAGTLGNLEGSASYFRWPKVVDGVASECRAYAPTDNVNEALAWLRSTREPWLLYLAFNLAHVPFHEPPPELHTTDVPSIGFPDVVRRAKYKAMVEALDAELGILLCGMDRDVLANTMVVFVGDNGTAGIVLESPPLDRTHGKDTLYQEGVQVPLIVAGPLVRRPGARTDAFVSTTDVFATVADIAGVAAGATGGPATDSVSFLPYLADPELPSLRRTLFTEKFAVNGASDSFPSPDDRWDCQEDIGGASPGSGVPRLELCGPPLAFGNRLGLSVSGAPPLRHGVLLRTDVLAPVPWNGAAIIAADAAHTAVVTDASGCLHLPDQVVHDDEGADGEGRTYLQVAFHDAVRPGGWVVSNAVSVRFLMYDLKAIQGPYPARFKLITNLFGGDELYDLKADPFEQRDLLANGVSALAPDQRTAYDALREELVALAHSR